MTCALVLLKSADMCLYLLSRLFDLLRSAEDILSFLNPDDQSIDLYTTDLNG